MFIGREKELEYLNKRYESQKAEFIVLYGRRRIGKTELIRNFILDKEYIFYSASEVDDYEQLKRISSIVKNQFNLSDINLSFNTWDDLFLSIKKIKSDKKLIFVIDEFPYMVNSNNSIPSILQNLWDHELKNSNIMLILSGSSISFMLDDLLGSNNPLYGRATGTYKLDELKINEIRGFFPNYSNEDLVTAYSILGGVPQYLLSFDNKLSIEENVKENILSKGSYLYDEVSMLMRQELRETSIYFTLLEAIAMGNTKLNQIYQMTQIDKTKINTYLNRLIKIDVIEREHPVTEKVKKKANVQLGLYKIKNSFFKFYFRYLFPNTSLLEMQAIDLVYENIIKEDLFIHTSEVFENTCREYTLKRNVNGQLNSFYHFVGRWWQKQNEIDVLAYDKKNNYLFGECKWRNKKVGLSDLNQLNNKISLNFSECNISQIIMFSKSGFTEEIIKHSKNISILELVNLDDIINY